MCRDIANGGRRCPSHSNPNLIAKRNAKRRAKYSEKNGTSFTSSTSHNPKDSLGIEVSVLDDPRINYQYVNGKQISGTIDYTKLDENSYKEFGFAAPNVERNTLMGEHDLDFLVEQSAEETSILTNQERAALRFFTSDEFEWVNRALYGDKATPSEIVQDSDQDILTSAEEFLDPDDDAGEADIYLIRDTRTPAVLKEVTKYMDSAMEKSVSKQRKVYRGMSPSNVAFNDMSVQDFVDKNLKLGSEIVFDGYQSTSLSASTALSYNANSGIFFEILTSEGVNVVSLSEYEEECEVLLPRGSRYMVVGVHDAQITANSFAFADATLVQLVAITDKGSVCSENNRHVIPKLKDEQVYGSEKLAKK